MTTPCAAAVATAVEKRRVSTTTRTSPLRPASSAPRHPHRRRTAYSLCENHADAMPPSSSVSGSGPRGQQMAGLAGVFEDDRFCGGTRCGEGAHELLRVGGILGEHAPVHG